jgi:hypothetical protein
MPQSQVMKVVAWVNASNNSTLWAFEGMDESTPTISLLGSFWWWNFSLVVGKNVGVTSEDNNLLL